jgi:hypothetical protein
MAGALSKRGTRVNALRTQAAGAARPWRNIAMAASDVACPVSSARSSPLNTGLASVERGLDFAPNARVRLLDRRGRKGGIRVRRRRRCHPHPPRSAHRPASAHSRPRTTPGGTRLRRRSRPRPRSDAYVRPDRTGADSGLRLRSGRRRLRRSRARQPRAGLTRVNPLRFARPGRNRPPASSPSRYRIPPGGTVYRLPRGH